MTLRKRSQELKRRNILLSFCSIMIDDALYPSDGIKSLLKLCLRSSPPFLPLFLDSRIFALACPFLAFLASHPPLLYRCLPVSSKRYIIDICKCVQDPSTSSEGAYIRLSFGKMPSDTEGSHLPFYFIFHPAGFWRA